MTAKRRIKYVHEGQFAAAVDVEWIEADHGWPPYLSVQDAERLDDAREALRRGDLKKASEFGRIYKLTPLAS